MTSQLETVRLILRPFLKTDAKAMVGVFNRKEIAQITTHISFPYTIDNAHAFIKKAHDTQNRDIAVYFGMIVKDSGEFIGEVHLKKIRRDILTSEMGFGLAPLYWNKGFATEAGLEIIRHGFKEHKLRRITAETMSINYACRRVLEKLGMRLEGVMREEFKQGNKYVDFAHYAVLRSDWKPHPK